MQRQHLAVMGQEFDEHRLGCGGADCGPVRIGRQSPVLQQCQETRIILCRKVDGGLRSRRQRQQRRFAAITGGAIDEEVKPGLGKERVQRIVSPGEKARKGLPARPPFGKAHQNLQRSIGKGLHRADKRRSIRSEKCNIRGRKPCGGLGKPDPQLDRKPGRRRGGETERDDALPSGLDLGFAPVQPECARFAHATISSLRAWRSKRRA